MSTKAEMKSPITVFCDEESGLLWNELAGFLSISNARYMLLEQGAFDGVPRDLREMADERRGEGGGDKLEADYQAFRRSLTPEKRQELERKLYPAGRMYGMCP